jgi:hypothetical protein
MTDYVHYNQQGYNIIGTTIAEVIYSIEKNHVYEPPDYKNSIYPNPVDGNLQIQFVNVSLESQLTVKISDLAGSSIRQFNIPLKKEIVETVQIELSDFNNGLYIISTQLQNRYTIQKINIVH